MSESGVKDAVARRVVRPHELQQWHRNWNGTPNRKMLEQHNIETAIESLPRPRQWPSPLSASPAKMRAFYSGDDIDAAVLASYVGDYAFPGGPVGRIRVKDGQLTSAIGVGSVVLLAEAPGSFFDMR